MITWMTSCIWTMTRKSPLLGVGTRADCSDHHLSGPFHVPGAQPGDVLEIDILEYVTK
jgi:acetamidase/formamidase